MNDESGHIYTSSEIDSTGDDGGSEGSGSGADISGNDTAGTEGNESTADEVSSGRSGSAGEEQSGEEQSGEGESGGVDDESSATGGETGTLQDSSDYYQEVVNELHVIQTIDLVSLVVVFAIFGCVASRTFVHAMEPRKNV